MLLSYPVNSGLVSLCELTSVSFSVVVNYEILIAVKCYYYSHSTLVPSNPFFVNSQRFNV